MKLYIAGQITGLDEAVAYELFLRAENLLTQLGHEPLNPMKIVDQDEMRCYEDQLLDALEIVLVSSEALFMLANWRDSKGARIEHAIAEILGRPIYYEATELPIGSGWPEPKER